MVYINDLFQLNIDSSVVTIGKFDGNHLGHQALFETAASWKTSGTKVVVISLSIKYPQLFLDSTPTKLMTTLEKSNYDYPRDIDYFIDCDFTPEMMALSAEEFVKDILVDRLGCKKIVVGSDFRFGKGRKGDVGTLFELGRKYGFQTIAIQKVRYKGFDISSTRIRDAISDGDLKDAGDMLGTPYSVMGDVVEGNRIGRTIGFPTINMIAPSEKVLPPDGVYATKTTVNNRTYYSITNVGINPTVNNEKNPVRTVETHIFKFRSDVYGKIAKVEFFEFIRPETRFDSVKDLQFQIMKDSDEVRQFFEIDGFVKPKKKDPNRDPRFLTLDD